MDQNTLQFMGRKFLHTIFFFKYSQSISYIAILHCYSGDIDKSLWDKEKRKYTGLLLEIYKSKTALKQQQIISKKIIVYINPKMLPCCDVQITSNMETEKNLKIAY